MHIMCYSMLAQHFEPQAEESRTMIIMVICKAPALPPISSLLYYRHLHTIHLNLFLKVLFAQPRILASSVF